MGRFSVSDNYDDKHPAPHTADETPIARGVRINSDDAVRRASRKASVITSIKAGYGIADSASDEESINNGADLTHRKLKPRHIQLIGIGGTIGTALYVQIGRGLLSGGPGSLFLAFTIWFGDDLSCLYHYANQAKVFLYFVRHELHGGDGHLPTYIVAFHSVCGSLRRRGFRSRCWLELLRIRSCTRAFRDCRLQCHHTFLE